MNAEERRQSISDILQASAQPVSAGTLAARFSVSRQIIVGDIALLRAGGAQISATPRGYVVLKADRGLIRSVACRHDSRAMGAELQAIVAPLEVKEGEQDFSCLKNLYSRADIFGVDLYAVGLGEQIEGMVKELYAGNGAVRKTLHKYVVAR